MVKQLENNLKDVDLMSLRRIQVIEVLRRDFVEPEAVEQGGPAEEPGGSGEYPGLGQQDRHQLLLRQTPPCAVLGLSCQWERCLENSKCWYRSTSLGLYHSWAELA